MPDPIVAPTVSNGFIERDVITLIRRGGEWHELARDGFVQTPDTVPGPPRAVAATATGVNVALTWAAPLNTGGSAVTGYRITPYIAGVAQAPVTVGNVLAHTVTGLDGDTTYTFTVAAINTSGTGMESAPSGPATTSEPFTASDPTGMVFWGKTRDLAGAHGSSVAALTDVSTTGLNLADFAGLPAPLLETPAAALNNRKALRFNGANSFLRSLSAFGAPVATPRTMLMVLKADSVAGVAYAISGDGFDGALMITPTRFDILSSSSLHTSTGLMPLADTNAHVAIAIFDGATSAFYLDGGVPVVGQAGTTAMARISLGDYGGAPGSNAWEGLIADPMVYDRRLTLAEINRVGRQLAEYYGIAWTTAT